MKWFKADTDILDSPKVQRLIAREGFEGLGRWHAILCIVAKRMDSSNNCTVTYPLKTWANLLSSRPKAVLKFLSTLHEEGFIPPSRTLEETLKRPSSDLEETLKDASKDLNIAISIPNLLKKRDYYSKDLEATDKKLFKNPPPEVEVEVEVEVEREPPTESLSKPPANAGNLVQPTEKETDEETWKEVHTWNERKDVKWKLIHNPTPTLKKRIRNARDKPDFNLFDIIEHAKKSDFLVNAKFIDLLWIVSPSKTDKAVLNYQNIMEGKYDNTHGGNRKQGLSKNPQTVGSVSPEDFAKRGEANKTNVEDVEF